MLVDTHAHLDDREFAPDLPEVLARAERAGVGRVLTIGTDLSSSRAAVALAERHDAVWAAVGVHPNEASSWDAAVRRALEGLAGHPKVAAIGETGLDFHRDRVPPALQAGVFREHLALARESRLPVVIHSRQANPRVLEILREARGGTSGVMHCFSGSLEEAREFLSLGLKLALGGPLTYPNAEPLREVAAALPAEAFMLETDAPYLPPQGHRGERNEPAHVALVAERLAGIKGLSTADVARISTAGARDLFGLGLEKGRGELAYRIRRSLYLNVTNRCSNLCTFCGRQTTYRVKGHDLRLEAEPSAAEVLAAAEAGLGDCREVVFCGYGEPLLRLDLVREVAGALKARGLRVRVNTNGQASLEHGFPVPPVLKGLVDAYSVSLNAPDAESYERICRPRAGRAAFGAVVDFIRQAAATGAEVTATAVDLPGIDLEACRALAASLGAAFRVRPLDEVG